MAKLARKFGIKFQSGDACELLGWVHDLGKFRPAFQQYLLACHTDPNSAYTKVPHSRYGGDWLLSQRIPCPFALLIDWHHSGLKNVSESPRIEAIKSGQLPENVLPEAIDQLIQHGFDPGLCSDLKSKRATALWYRMAYSTLVDADHLDTESHFNPYLRRRKAKSPAAFSANMDKQLEHLASKDQTRVNVVRSQILQDCIIKSQGSRGIFSLTAPTGSGKTMSYTTFALRHAEKHGLDRVILALPYMTIIDQIGTQYRDLFNKENVLLHYSAFHDAEEENNARLAFARMAAESNWNASFIVTTNVQLMESLFSANRSRLRKLHNIANSLIILDEPQTLPTHLLKSTFDRLKELVDHFGCTVVLATATPFDYSLLGLDSVVELVPDVDNVFNALHRVKFTYDIRELDYDAVADMVSGHYQTYCIMNTRAAAKEVFNRVAVHGDAFHLSTNMCPKHRMAVLSEVKRRLNASEPCRLITTQLIECGVDLDFPEQGFRQSAPLPSVLQAGGRTNREGTRPEGICHVFELQDAVYPGSKKRQPGEYERMTITSRPYFKKYIDELSRPHIVRQFFASLHDLSNLDSREILQSESKLSFESSAKHYQLIDEDTVTVLTPYAANNLAADARSDLNVNGFVPSSLMSQIASYSVSIHPGSAIQAEKAGLVEPLHPNLPDIKVWLGDYHPDLGLYA